MSEYTINTVKIVISDNKKAIKSAYPKLALRDNPNLLEEEQKIAEEMISDTLNDLKGHYNELVPFVKKIKDRVLDITEETHFCAVYLLLCQTMTYWESLFLLAKNGNSSAIQLNYRTIKESLALAELFSFEFAEMEDDYLKKWFTGEIITHGVYRDKLKKFYKNISEEDIAFLKNTSRDLYQMESHSIHVAYTSVIEGISPFTEDFDFDKYTRFRRTSYNLTYVTGGMDSTNMALKFVYKFLLGDLDGYNNLDKILLKHTKNDSIH